MREHGFSLTSIFLNQDRVADSALIRADMGQSKLLFSHISRSDF